MATTKKAEDLQSQNDLVDVFIDRDDTKRDDAGFYVSVNDEHYLLPYGKTSQVPRYIAEEIERSKRANRAYMNSRQEILENAKAAQ